VFGRGRAAATGSRRFRAGDQRRQQRYTNLMTTRGLAVAIISLCCWLPAQEPAAREPAANAPTASATPALRIGRDLVLHDGVSTAVAFSHDGRWVASAGECGDLLLVDTERNEVVHTLLPSTGPIGRLAFAPHAPLLAIAGADVSVWSLPDARCVGRWPAAAGGALAWQPDGRWLAFAGARSTVQLVDIAAMQPLREVSFGFGVALSLALDRDGERLAVGTGDGRRLVVAVPSGEVLETRHCQTPVIGVGWTDDGRLLHANFDEMYGHYPAGGPVRFGIQAHGIELLRNGSTVLAYGKGPLAMLCPDGKTPEAVPAPGPIAFTADGRNRAVAAAGELWLGAWPVKQRVVKVDDDIRFEDVDDSRHVPLPHRGPVPPCWLTADGRHLLLQRAAGRIDQLDLDADRVVTRRLQASGPILAVLGNDEFVTASRTPIDGVWLDFWSAGELAQGAQAPHERRTLGPARESSLAADQPWPTFSPDGRWFTFGGRGYDRRGDRIVWRQPLRHDQRLLVGNDGQCAVAYGDSSKMTKLPQAIEYRRGDGSVQAVIGIRFEADVVLAPDSRRLLVQAKTSRQVVNVPELDVAWELPAGGAAAVWLDNEHVLLAPPGAVAVVEVHGRNGLVQRLELPAPVRQLAAAGRAGRAVAVLGDRIVVMHIDR
jgi:hypothetical protein